MTTENYKLSDIFKYEDITRNYCVSKNNINLSTRELISLAAMEDEFNIDYAFYLRFKHTRQIEEFIMNKDIGLGNSLFFITDDILNEEVKYEALISKYFFYRKTSHF